MLEKLNNEQLEKLLLHAIGMNRILMKAYLPNIGSGEEKALGESFDILMEEFDVKDCFLSEPAPLSKGVSFSEIAQRPFTSGYAEERRRKEQDMNLLCGRWMADNVRRGIEISRAGEHYVLTYLKRNGRPSDDRYVLIWMDGDIIFYGDCVRIISVALNTQTDTLMISPGTDYTRQTEEIK
ncbi:DUF3876 domain-containing protein [Dysgonomonas sp. 521]|uniref:DUF3876 domain-containing protein n=1 Tax=Dysgonomonas sp. 521 TaxID=2302932 RepID=UPI0013D1D318|nr:DUF3876 domain-containing protein [Dysgonomonas sp. 521]NDV95771.1 DUF3876 domain-containing protein [Dysgonomonas sp. 521]